MKRNPQFEARLYQARPDRGPQNKHWTREDLQKLLYKMKGVNVWYNHGDDERFKEEPIGKIVGAYLDDEDYLVVKGLIHDPETIGEDKWHTIREELRSGVLKMVSMSWGGKTQFPTTNEDEKVAIPESREMKEISLVTEGAYPEASIIAVAASKTRSDQKSNTPLYTPPESDSSTVIEKFLQTMSETSQPAPSPLEAHAALKKALGKMTPEEEKVLANPENLLQVYNKIFSDTSKELGEFRAAKRRELEDYVSTGKETAKKLAEELNTHWDDEAEKAKLVEYLESDATVPESKGKWGFVSKLATNYINAQKQLSEIQSSLPAVEKAVGTMPDNQISVAASLARQESKKQNTQSAQPMVSPTVSKLLDSLNNRTNW